MELLNPVWDKIKKMPEDHPEREALLRTLEALQNQEINILLAGATGVGKSSTINAIFDAERAKVGYHADPETKLIQKYELGNITLWDTPGLGDSPENDKLYAVQIANALKARNSSGDLLIDEVLVLIDGSNKDMGTAYQLIENIVLPYMDDPSRIVVAINQCDMALKGKDWTDAEGPGFQLTAFLEEKAASVKRRIYESTGVKVQPVFYSAFHHYNISKLLAALLHSLPEKKRFLVADAMNKDPQVWRKNDDLENYNQKIETEVTGSLEKALSGAAKGAAAGASVGKLIPVLGPVIGAAVGAALGFLGGLID